MKSLIPVLVASLIILLVFSSGCTGDILTKVGVGDFGGTTSSPTAGTSAGTSSGTSAGSVVGTTTGAYDACMITCEQHGGLDNGRCAWTCCVAGCSEDSPDVIDVCIDKCTSGVLAAYPNGVSTLLPVTTITTGMATNPAVTSTTAAASSGTCSPPLTQCRVFSTDYCVDLMTDVNHCGACRWGCPLPNAENGCSGGKCYIKSCNIGWADCNGIAEDGCEVDLDSDDNNCGKCGRVCSLPNSHAICAGEDGDGICEVEYCHEGWLNGNGLHTDGCEVFQN